VLLRRTESPHSLPTYLRNNRDKMERVMELERKDMHDTANLTLHISEDEEEQHQRENEKEQQQSEKEEEQQSEEEEEQHQRSPDNPIAAKIVFKF
jgi:hypothetical protein